MSTEERPAWKTPGGKGDLLEILAPLLPPRREVKVYGEPFYGGGAMYLYEFAEVRPAWVGDADPCVMNALDVVCDGDLDALISALARHRDMHAENKVEHYYATRALVPANLDPVERAARFIYLSKTCFNGLRRYNKAGRNNVPIGSFKNPGICQPDVLRWNRARLQGVERRRGDLSVTISDAGPGHFIFLDPPYVEVSATAKFTGYIPGGFKPEDHRRVASCFRWLTARGAKAMLTNSDTPISRELYRGFRIVEYGATRSINSKGAKRGRVGEIAVLNY